MESRPRTRPEQQLQTINAFTAAAMAMSSVTAGSFMAVLTPTKNVNQVESQTTASSAWSLGGPSISPPSSAAASSARLFTNLDNIHGPLIEDLGEVEVCHLTMYASTDVCNMVSQLHEGRNTPDTTGNCEYVKCCKCCHISYFDTNSDWAIYASSVDIALQKNHAFATMVVDRFPTKQLAFLSLEMQRQCRTLMEIGRSGQPGASSDGSSFVDAQGKAPFITDARMLIRFGSTVFREGFIMAALTSPLISMGRLLREGWLSEGKPLGMFFAESLEPASPNVHVKALA
eukprot:s31_g10.t1